MYGYKCIRSDSTSRHSAGIIVYVKDSVQYRIVKDIVYALNNVLIVDILNGPCRGKWIFVYHSPNTSHSVFLNRLEQLFDDELVTTLPIRLIGDFNINFHQTISNTYKTRLRLMALKYDLRQIVSDFTRYQRGSKTMIDLCFISDKSIKVTVSKDNQIADHCTLFLNKIANLKVRQFIRVTDRRELYTEPKLIEKFCEQYDQTRIFRDINEKVAYISDTIDFSTNELVKYKFINIAYSKEWYNRQLSDLKSARDLAQSRAGMLDDEQSWTEYKRLRNEYNRLINKCKSASIEDKINECIHDSKRLWKELKLMTSGHKQISDTMEFDNEIICDKEVIANKFNEYSIESIKHICDSIPQVQYSPPNVDRQIVNWYQFELTNAETVMEILNCTRTMSGLNNVNVSVIKIFMNNCPDMIVNIINECLTDGVCPDVWKYTVVTPIPKVTNSMKAEDMRPINLAPSLDKLLQAVVKRQLDRHLEQNDIITRFQSAFRDKHSCETSLNLILNALRHKKAKKRCIITVFLDLKRAFETVDRTILLKKLRDYGMRGKVLKWFESWLSDRRQYTAFCGVRSAPLPIETGVPQGTPLSCPLFNLYFNDVVTCVRNCNINLFADDVLLWVDASTTVEAIDKIETDLTSIMQYLNMCKLKLNVNKTKFMIIGSHSEIDSLNFGGESIEKVQEMKYLGIIIDDQLNFKRNAEQVAKKMSKMVGFLSRNRKKIPPVVRLTLYKCMIGSFVDFNSTILFLNNDNEINLLQRIQNRAMRNITHGNRYSRITDMLQQTNLMSIKQRICYNVLILIYKATRNMLPNYLSVNIIRTSDIQPYQLRGNTRLRPLPSITFREQDSIWYKGINMFNDMSRLFDTNCDNVNAFKRQAVIYIKQVINP